MPGKSALVAESVGYVLDSDVSRVRKQRPKPDAGRSGDGAVESHTPKNHAEYAGHNSPPCCSSSQGDQRAVSPARWRTGRLFRSRPPAPRSPQRVFWSSPGRRQRRLQLRIRAKPQAPSAFAFRRRSVRRRRPDPPKHHVTPRGVRRYRDSASRLRAGNPATRSYLVPGSGPPCSPDAITSWSPRIAPMI